jgi:hypothetical protein
VELLQAKRSVGPPPLAGKVHHKQQKKPRSVPLPRGVPLPPESAAKPPTRAQLKAEAARQVRCCWGGVGDVGGFVLLVAEGVHQGVHRRALLVEERRP